MPSTARTAAARPTGRSLGHNRHPQPYLPRGGRTHGRAHGRTHRPPPVLSDIAFSPSTVADTSAGQTAPKYLRAGAGWQSPCQHTDVAEGDPRTGIWDLRGRLGLNQAVPGLAGLIPVPSTHRQNMGMPCRGQSHRCRRSHHPCSPQGPTRGRCRAGTGAAAG